MSISTSFNSPYFSILGIGPIKMVQLKIMLIANKIEIHILKLSKCYTVIIHPI